MTLKEIRDDYVRYSKNVSDLCRNLSYAGIAIVWIFKRTNKNEIDGFLGTIPTELIYPLLLFIAVLLLDLLQYVIQTLIWYPFYVRQRKENLNNNEEDIIVQEPEIYNLIPWFFWITKLVLAFIAYVILGLYLL